DVAGLERRIRIVGRNLQPRAGRLPSVRLRGPATYTLETVAAEDGDSSSVTPYVAEAVLPKKLAPGLYKVGFSRDGQTWTDTPDQLFEVYPDPDWPELRLDSAAFGRCKPNESTYSDECLQRAISAARQAGGATITLPAGSWNSSGDVQF